jgi:hypothetical protein
VKQVSPGSYNGGEARVCVIGANTGEEMSLKKEMGEVLSSQGKEMGEILSMASSIYLGRYRMHSFQLPDLLPPGRTLSTQMSVMMEEA